MPQRLQQALEELNKPFINYQDINKLVLNNQELKSLRNMHFNLATIFGQEKQLKNIFTIKLKIIFLQDQIG